MNREEFEAVLAWEGKYRLVVEPSHSKVGHIFSALQLLPYDGLDGRIYGSHCLDTEKAINEVMRQWELEK